MPTSNAEELGLFLKCTVIGRGVLDLAPAGPIPFLSIYVAKVCAAGNSSSPCDRKLITIY